MGFPKMFFNVLRIHITSSSYVNPTLLVIIPIIIILIISIVLLIFIFIIITRITCAKEYGKASALARHWFDCPQRRNNDPLERCRVVDRVRPLMVVVTIVITMVLKTTMVVVVTMLVIILVMMKMTMVVVTMRPCPTLDGDDHDGRKFQCHHHHNDDQDPHR